MESNSNSKPQPQPQPRTCLCSPTTHPGSFRCSLHRNFNRAPTRSMPRVGPSRNNWEVGVIAKANLIRALLLQIIKPSSHDLQRRRNFQPRPTRFCSVLPSLANPDGFARS